jgi:transcription-repair coupling factor (superfamily II helicase)
MPPPVVRLVEVAELRLAAEAAGVASMAREEGQLVVRFGEGMTRATAMRLLSGGGLPGVKPSDVTFASNQVRIRLPRDLSRAWGLTQAVVARLSASEA